MRPVSQGDSSSEGTQAPRRRRARDKAPTAEQLDAQGQLNEVRQEFSRWKREHATGPSEATTPLLRTPFMSEIMLQLYPYDLCISGSKDYDGRTDPEVHVNSYYGNMLMMGVSDAVMCRAFYSTLSGRPADWFRTLEPGSITCFANLATKFVRKFVTSKAVRKHYMYLEKAKQLEGDNLIDFLSRWKIAIGEIEPMDDLTAIHMLHMSLSAGDLYQDFILHPPGSYEEALRRVTYYANAGEANAAKRSQEVGSSHKPTGRSENRLTDQHARGRGRQGDFTPLNRSAAKALQCAQSCNLVKLPDPMRDGKDKTKYCASHRCQGHDAEDCTNLKQLLEDLLNAGKLDKCVGERKSSKRSGGRRGSRRSDHDRKDLEPDQEARPSSKPTIQVIFWRSGRCIPSPRTLSSWNSGFPREWKKT
ncbi:PREDICTED: uncharacterized protein LOC109174032 [Ipomoea nil]|uniref:uncharacterized protein LOC109174032 n=1 Tax=Ipomoea nil TaxID=35883 RepID=UPI000901087A|nr:PREDICTED: uncharacterized protein LOC109174032 [Ipomoea nil]